MEDLERRQNEVKVEDDVGRCLASASSFSSSFLVSNEGGLVCDTDTYHSVRMSSECRKTNGVLPLLHNHLRYFLHYFK